MEVKIERLDNFGNGITHLNNKIVFVKRALPDEIVDIEIYKEKKDIAFANIIKIIKPSKDRVDSICPYYSLCGGCNFLHTTNEIEKDYKINKAKYLFNRCDNYYETSNLNYRNKITLHYKDNKLGLYEEESNKIIDIDYCYLVDDKINEIIKELKSIIFNNECEIIIRSFNDKTLVSIKGDINDINLNCDTLIINDKVIKGDGYLYFDIDNYKIRLGKDAFFQVNLEGLNNIYKIIERELKEKRFIKALDLYSGVSLWSILINKYVDKIDSIEINEEACLNAKYNIENNNIRNINIINGKVEDYIDKFKDIDLIISDPPRSGMDKKTISNILSIKPKEIIYVSCDMNTLKRDIELLNEYKIKEVNIVNMFKMTYHCETVAILERK